MTVIVYTLYSILNKKIVDPFDFYEWFFFAPGHKAAWLVFFSFGAGFFVAMSALTEEYTLLYPAVVCLTTISTFGLKVARQPTKEVVKTVEVEKIVTVQKEVLVYPGSNCGAIYIMRRQSDGVLKFGKAQRLVDRWKAHQKDYQSEFDIVSSWIVPDMDYFETVALSLTRGYFYHEAQRRELRQMTESELTQFILEFTNIVHKGWMQ